MAIYSSLSSGNNPISSFTLHFVKGFAFKASNFLRASLPTQLFENSFAQRLRIMRFVLFLEKHAPNCESVRPIRAKFYWNSWCITIVNLLVHLLQSSSTFSPTTFIRPCIWCFAKLNRTKVSLPILSRDFSCLFVGFDNVFFQRKAGGPARTQCAHFKRFKYKHKVQTFCKSSLQDLNKNDFFSVYTKLYWRWFCSHLLPTKR